MNVASSAAQRWSVSARAAGEVLTASVPGTDLQISMLGVPSIFSPTEVEGWLADLAGVARETSRADQRTRAIPPLLHHALTGLLFSQAELWAGLDEPMPCSLAFVTTDDSASFGWVGDAHVRVRVNGQVIEPQWVRVRDDAGREAHATAFGPGVRVEVDLAWGADANGMPLVSLAADWTAPAPAAPVPAASPFVAGLAPAAPVPESDMEPDWARFAPNAVQNRPIPSTAEVPSLPGELPQDQPALHAPITSAYQMPVAPPPPVPPAVQPPPVVPAPPAIQAPPVAQAGRPPQAPPVLPLAESWGTPATPAVEDDARPHPVQNWLSRMVTWGRKPEAADDDAVVSTDPEPAPPQPIGEVAPPAYMPEPSPANPIAGRPPVWTPEDAPRAPVVPPVAAPRPAMAPPPPPTTFAPVGIHEVLGTPRASDATPEPPAAEPPSSGGEPGREPLRDPEPDLRDALPMLRTEFLHGTPLAFEITHEPVGAHETFSIPPLPEGELAPIDESRSSGPPPLPTDANVTAAPSGAETLIIESHVGASTEPMRREIPSHVGPPVLPATTPGASGPDRTSEGEFTPSQPAMRGPLASPPSLWGMATSAPAPLERLAPERPVAAPPAPVESTYTSSYPEPAVLEWTGAPVELPAPTEAPVVPDDWIPTTPEPAAAWGTAPSIESASAPASGAPQSRMPRLPRPAWPRPEAAEAPEVDWRKKYAPWAALLVVLVAAGWWLGHLDSANHGTPRWLRAIGWGGARFDLVLGSHPPGAWINVDGKDLQQRTPANIDLPPGEHQVRLSMPDLGSATFPVKGGKGERVEFDLPLSGSLEIMAADPRVPLNVSVNGKPMGFAPVLIDSIAPGLHEITFSGPGMPAWGQTVQVGIHQAAQVVARAVTSPGTGVIQVQAILNDEGGTSPLNGARVFVDGEPRGMTPLSVELPRGPHSLRVEWHGTSSPVQVIDLPGGNQRFATFNLGLEEDGPVLSLVSTPRFTSAMQTNVVSAEIAGLQPGDVRESWLHVRAAEGVWRRYALTAINGPLGAVVVGVFPPGSFDSDGRTRWYVSASTRQGDEFFSDLQIASIGAPARPRPKPEEVGTEP